MKTLKEFRHNIWTNLNINDGYLWTFIKDFYDKYDCWKNIDLNDLKDIQKIIWYIDIDIKNSWKEKMNYYDMKWKKIFLEPKVFQPKNFSIESIWLLIHETLHIYFTKWTNQNEFVDFIFDEKKPLFSQVFNVFEDIRINNLSNSFFEKWEDYIKLIYLNYWSKEKWNLKSTMWNSLELIHYSIIKWVERLWDKRLNKFMKDELLWCGELKWILKEKTNIIDDFINSIYSKKYSDSIDKIRKNSDSFLKDINEKIYPLIIEDLEQEQQSWWRSWMNSKNDNSKSKWNWKWWENYSDDIQSYIEWIWSSMDPFNWENNEDQKELMKEDNSTWNSDDLKVNDSSFRKWNKKSENELFKKTKEYIEVKNRNFHIINSLKSRFLQKLEKRRTKVEEWFNKWKTISSNKLIKNILRNKTWEIKRNEILNWTFKKINQKWNKILNLVFICIDKSWSMNWDNIETAKEASIIIVEALRNLDTKFSINAYDADNYTIYDWDYSNDYKNIIDIQSWGWTSEINTLNEVEKRFDFLKKTIWWWYNEINWISMLITDWFWDSCVKESVEKLKKKNIFCYWIWIWKFCWEKELEKAYWENWYIKLSNLKDLPKLLPELIIKKLK